MERISDPLIRRAQRVLVMVHELHKQGYQNLAIYPGMSPSGTSWRCEIAPVSHMAVMDGSLEMNDVHPRMVASYSSGEAGNHYFDWTDSESDSARELAKKFIDRYPDLVSLGRGRNWEYAGWFNEVLGVSESGALPVAYDDGTPFSGYLRTTGDIRLSLPPLEGADFHQVGGLKYRYRSTSE